MKKKQPRYFERPDQDQKPLGFWGMLAIIVATHLGVRRREQRIEDFKRANGLHLFIGGLVYFVLIIVALIVFINYQVLD